MTEAISLGAELVDGVKCWWHVALNEKLVAPLLQAQVSMHVSPSRPT
jgi:hypothetical protein